MLTETPSLTASSPSSHSEPRANPIKSFITGGFGGLCSVISCYPLDIIKVRLQTMPCPPPYNGTLDCAVKIVRKEGIRGLYRGLSAPLLSVTPMLALDFALYAAGKRLLQSESHVRLSYAQIFLAGTFSGMCSALIMTPGERIKVVLQTQQGSKYNGVVDCGIKLFKEGGLRSVFKGSCATMLRDSPSGAYFLVYEYLQDLAKQNSATGKISPSSTIFAGGAAGVTYWFLAIPFDVLKSRLQAAPDGIYKHGIRSVYMELMAKEGLNGLFHGMTPILMRAFPATAVMFFGMELGNDFFRAIAPNF